MTFADYIPTQAEIAARRARMGIAPAARPIVLIKPVEPKPEAKAPEQKQKLELLSAIVTATVSAPLLAPSKPTECPTLEEIKRLVSIVHRIPLTEILSDSRHPALVKARDHIVWLACRHTYKSLPQIGAAIGSRDHTTALHSLYKTIKARGKACRGHTPESIANRVERRRVYMRGYERKRDRIGRYQRADAT
jgi:hypothetical protein